MKNLASWKFSEACVRIDLLRICREALNVSAAGLIRVTIGDRPVTLASHALLGDFFEHAPLADQLQLRDMPIVALESGAVLSYAEGELELATPGKCGGVSSYYLLPCDCVGLLAARRKVVVEVF